MRKWPLSQELKNEQELRWGRVSQVEGTVHAQAFWQEGACGCMVVRKASPVSWSDGMRLWTIRSCVHLSLVLLLGALGGH